MKNTTSTARICRHCHAEIADGVASWQNQDGTWQHMAPCTEELQEHERRAVAYAVRAEAAEERAMDALSEGETSADRDH